MFQELNSVNYRELTVGAAGKKTACEFPASDRFAFVHSGFETFHLFLGLDILVNAHSDNDNRRGR
jgi:hypothetical protein